MSDTGKIVRREKCGELIDFSKKLCRSRQRCLLAAEFLLQLRIPQYSAFSSVDAVRERLQ